MSYSSHFSQNVIEGKITEEGKGKPVVNANVYILKTLLGSSSGTDGKYEIKNIPDGYFTVVVSHVNYKTVKKVISLDKNKTVSLNFKLKPKLLQLPEIVVEGTEDEEWEDNFKLFKQQLLGIDLNARQCEILNPYSVEFTKTAGGWLKAKCKEPIIINNYALGYKLTYFLEYFETNGRTTKFSGQPYFEEIKPHNGEDENIYKNNRLKTYCGSLTHFLRTLIEQYDYLKGNSVAPGDVKSNRLRINGDNEKLTAEGFDAFTANGLPWESRYKPLFYPVDVSKIISKCENNTFYCLTFKNYLQVTYKREWEEYGYLEMRGLYNQAPGYQTSWIKLHKPEVLVDKNGHFFNEFAIETFGYWSYEKLADMLPYEYSVDDSTLVNVNWTY